MNSSRIIKRSLVIVLPVLVLMLATSALAVSPNARPDHIHLSWKGEPTTTMLILWRTHRNVATSLVEYGTDQNLGQTAEGSYNNYGENARTHRVELTGLSPDTQYFYRCGSPNNGMSQIYSFSTASADPCTTLRFVVAGDSRNNLFDGASDAWFGVASAILNELPDFVLMNGDLIKEGDKEAGWDTFFEKAAPLLAQVPLMAAWGNHDDRDGSLFPDVFEFAEGPNGPDYYSIDIGVLHMLVLDSEHGSGAYQDQVDWLNTDLPANEGKWKMAMSHRPAYSSGTTHGSDDEVQQYFLPVFDQHKLDIFFGSHDHIYERTCFIKNKECQANASQGTLYYVTGGAGAAMNPIGGGEWFTEHFFGLLNQFHYILVELAFDSITLSAKDTNGSVQDEIGWSKDDPIAPVATIEVSSTTVQAGQPLFFDGTASSACGGTIVYYSWNMGNGEKVAQPSFEYIYEQPGTYTVTLKIHDNDDMTDEATTTIQVTEPDDDDSGDDDNDDGDPERDVDGDDDGSCGCGN